MNNKISHYKFEHIFREEGLYVADSFKEGVAFQIIKNGLDSQMQLHVIKYNDPADTSPEEESLKTYGGMFDKVYYKVSSVKDLFAKPASYVDISTIRIGNYLRARSVGHLEFEEPVKIGTHYFQCLLNKTIDVQGIPLTRKYLTKLGFKKEREANPQQDLHARWSLVVIDIYETLDGEGFMYATRTQNGEFKAGVNISTVHQLQNLFFDLTLKELILQEND